MNTPRRIRIGFRPFDCRNEPEPESFLEVFHFVAELFFEKLQIANAPAVNETRSISHVLQARIPERLAMVLNERSQILDRKLLKHQRFRLNSGKDFIGQLPITPTKPERDSD